MILEDPMISDLLAEHPRYYCRACMTYHQDSNRSKRCTCGRFASEHCVESHVPAVIATTLPAIACGATARMIAGDTGMRGMNAARVHFLIRTAQRLFGLVVGSATLAATRHGKGNAKHYWFESTVPGQADRIAQLTRLVMRD